MKATIEQIIDKIEEYDNTKEKRKHYIKICIHGDWSGNFSNEDESVYSQFDGLDEALMVINNLIYKAKTRVLG